MGRKRIPWLITRILTAPLSGGWTPDKISGLTLWLNADDIAGSDGDAIAAWADKSGNGNDFAQSDNNKKPLLKKGANGISGHNIARFDGNDDIMVASKFSSDQAGTIFVVLKLNTVLKGLQDIIASSDEATTAGHYWILRPYNQTFPAEQMSVAVSSGGNTVVRGGTNTTTGVNYLMMWKSSGSAFTLRLNGADEALTVQSGADNGNWIGDETDCDNITIGGVKWDAEAQWFRGDVAEIIWYNTGLSATDIAKVENYLANRYGIVLNP